MFTQSDYNQLDTKGITVSQVVEQLQFFEHGFPALKIHSSASTAKGIKVVSQEKQDFYLKEWDNYLKSNCLIVKFVPASGAASRMFKNLFEFLDSNSEQPDTPYLQKFFAEIKRFAFYTELQKTCLQVLGKNIEELIAENNYKAIVELLLTKKGLNYGNLPKGLLLFHTYPDCRRTAFEEHLAEGAQYAANGEKTVNLHFTVSAEHRALFQSLAEKKLPLYAQKFGVHYNIEFSEQKPSTDTIAVDAENQPFRENGTLLFRPGGHGALIENLNDLNADVVFIKNIDNVAPDALRPATVRYKRLIAGILTNYQKRIFSYLDLLDSGRYTREQLLEMLYFMQNELCIKNPETKFLEDVELALYIRSKLNRPLRVCGMVKNQSEPGGGPFLTYGSDGTISPQILESSQIDLNNQDMKKIFDEGTHFNPVDLVCGLKNYRGEKFDLTKFVDKNTGFISHKSNAGRELRALELPGLWNGAMSDWNTVFVEVPIETFSPVKSVNDLLRAEHQV